MNLQFQLLPFSEIKEKFPKESWVYWRNEKHEGEFENETILYLNGDTEVSYIDLENVVIDGHDFPDYGVFAILVDGNLTVHNYIYNENTDGAAGLLVLGNLKTRNAVVGGQEIFVTGNMEVEELFWGNYNHGDLVVNGDAQVGVFADTEEYHVTIKGRKNFGVHLSACDESDFYEGLQEKIISRYIQPECWWIDEDNDDELYLEREKMLDFFKENKSVIIKENIGKPAPLQEFPILFPTPEINTENMLRLANSCLMRLDNNVYKFSFQIKDIFFRVVKSRTDLTYAAVYLEKSDQYATLIEAKKPEEQETQETSKKGLFDFLKKKTPEPAPPQQSSDFVITTKVRYLLETLSEEQKQWYWFDENQTPENFKLLLKYGWQQLLVSVSQFEFYQIQFSPEDIEQTLALPVVQPYDDFYDNDKNGFWNGNIYPQFRQKGALYENKPQSALLKVARECKNADGETVIEYYLFIVEEDGNGNKTVRIKYNPDQNNSSSKTVPFYDTARLEAAHSLFSKAIKKISALNKKLLQGFPPYNAEDFALKYWQEKGYIKE